MIMMDNILNNNNYFVWYVKFELVKGHEMVTNIKGNLLYLISRFV